MKLHLPLALRAALLAVLCVTQAWAERTLTIDGVEQENWYGIIDDDLGGEEIEITLSGDISNTVELQGAGYIGSSKGSSATITVNGGEFTQSGGRMASSEGSSVTITVNGGEFTQSGGGIGGAYKGNATITVNKGGEFTQSGGSMGYGGRLDIIVNEGGIFTQSGSLTNGYIGSGSGNTITVKGQFVQKGGNIAGFNYDSVTITVDKDGEFTQEGGFIAYAYGANATIIVNGGKFTQKVGGIIAGTSSYGVTITVDKDGEFTQEGGYIAYAGEANNATIIVNDGKFTQEGGFIAYAVGTNATITVNDGGEFTSTGGHLGYSGSVTIDVKKGGNFSKSGGYISNGTMTVEEYGTFTLSGDATVSSGNTITVKGQFVQEGGTIKSYTSSVVSIGESGVYTMSGGTNGAAVTVNHGGSYVLSGSAEVTGEVTLKGGSLDLGNLQETDATIVFQDGTMSNAQNYAGTLKVETDEETTVGEALNMAGINGSKLKEFNVQSNKEGVSLINFAAGNTLTLSGENMMTLGSANAGEKGALFQFADGNGTLNFDTGATITFRNIGILKKEGECWLTNASTVTGWAEALRNNYELYGFEVSLQQEAGKGWKLTATGLDQLWIASVDGTEVNEGSNIGNYTNGVIADRDLTLTLTSLGATQVHNLTDGGIKGGFSVSGAGGVVVELVNSRDTTMKGDITVTGGAELRKTGTGTFTFSGTLSTDGELVIQEGSFTQSGGYIAKDKGFSATITVNDGGEFTSTGGYLGYDGSVTIDVKGGGNFSKSGGYIRNGTITVEKYGTFTLSGDATIAYGKTMTVNGDFVQEGGTINSYTSAEVIVGEGGVYTMSGGTNNATTTVKAGGNYNYSGGTIGASNFTVEDGGYFNLVKNENYTHSTALKGAGHITVNDRATYDLNGNKGTLDIIMRGGKLTNAGSYTHNARIDTGADYSGEVSLGGLNAARIESVTIAGAATSITEMAKGSTLSFHKGDSITVGSGHMSDAGGEARDGYILNFTDGSGTVAFAEEGAVVLNFGAGVFDDVMGKGNFRKEIWLTNGTIDGVPTEDIEGWLEEHFVLGAGLEDLSLTYIEGVNGGGKLLLYGNADGIWIASRNGQEVTSVTRLDKFNQVQADVDLTLNPGEEGTMHVRQLQSGGGTGDLIVESVEGLRVQLDNEHTDENGSNGNTDFLGNIRVEDGAGATAILEKTGSASLTVSGNVTTGGVVQVSEGTLALEGEGNSIGSLAMGGTDEEGNETSGTLQVDGTLTLTGRSVMTEESRGSIIGTGTVKMGRGASFTLERAVSYTVQKTELTGGAQMEQQGGEIKGGTFTLNGAGTGFTQMGGSMIRKASFTMGSGTTWTQSVGVIWDCSFTVNAGAKMEQRWLGEIQGGTFTLNGAGARLIQEVGGSIIGGVFTLSGGATMTARGSIIGGTFTLIGTSEDGAKLVLDGGRMTGRVTLEGAASSYDMGNQAAGGSVLMQGGKLENAGSYTGSLTIQTGGTYEGELKLGGVDAACITSITTEGSGTYLTGLKAGSTLTLSGENSMAVSTDNLNYEESNHTYLIQFEGGNGTIAFADGEDEGSVGFELKLDAKVIAALRKQEGGVELYFTNGQITGAPGEEDSQEWRDWVKEHIHFTETLESLGYAVVGIGGGKLLISGSTKDIYFVTAHGQTVTSPLQLGRYAAVVADETLTLDFNVTEEPAENSVIHNLRSGASNASGDLLVGKSGEKALTLELNNTEDSEFLASSSGVGGNLTVTVEKDAGELSLIKTGKEKLTVGGNLTTSGSLEVQEGTLELGGAASSVGSLEVESSAKLVLSDKAKLTMGNHQLTTGRISGPGELDWDGGLSLSGTVELDGVKLDMEKGESLKIDGVTVRMGNGQIGGVPAAEVNVTNHGEFELEEGNIDSAGTAQGVRVSVYGAGFTQSGGYIGDGAQFELKHEANLTQSGGEIAGGTFSLSGGTTMSQDGEISGGTFTLNAGTTMTQSWGEIKGGTFRLSGEGANLTQDAVGIISGGEFTLSGGASLRQKSSNSIISGGIFTLSGAGTSITQMKGTISGKASFTLNAGTTMTQDVGKIEGGTFRLSGEGANLTQDAGGIISGGEFTLSGGASLRQEGSASIISGGTFTLEGKGASLTQGARGSISGGAFTLSGGVTMTTSGSITGGVFALSGEGTNFTQSAGSIGEGVEITLKDGAELALSGGSMSGSVTMEDTASVYDMGNQAAGGSVVMKGGRLENAGAFAGKLSIETGDSYTAALELGGVDAARITKVVMGSSRTELHGLKSGSTLTFSDSASKMVVGSEHIAQGDATGTAMVQFEEDDGQIAFGNEGKLLLHLESEVLEGIEGQKEIVFTNGSFSGMPEGQEELETWLAQHFVLETGMEEIEVLLLDDVHGGRLVLTGSTSGIWLTSHNGQSVDVVDRLNHYSAVVVDKDLTLTLPTTAEEHPTIVKQLQNSEGQGDFIVQTEGGATANHTVQMNNVHTDAETQNGNTDFYGDIHVEGTGLQAATLEKTGDAQLTVHGNVTTGGTVQLSEGTLKLAGAGNGIGALAMNGGELDVAGKLRLTGTTAMTGASTGTITGEGTVEMGSGASLTLAGSVSYTVQNTDLTDGAQMKQQGGSSITGGSFQLIGYGTAFEQEGGSISKTNFSLTEGAAMEAGGSVTGGSFVLRGEGTTFTQTGGSLSGVEFELSNGATMTASGSITGGGFELSGSGTSFTQSGGSMDDKTTISLKDGAKLVLAGGSMAGSVTLEGAASSYDMRGQTARGSVLMKGGKLENAGGFDGELSIQTAESYSGEIKLGGVNAACITNIQLGAAGTYLTGLKTGSTLTLRGENSLVVDCKQFNYTGTSPTYLIRFENESGSVTFAEEDGEGGSVGVLLKLSAKEIATLRQLGGEAEFYFTNGQITGAPDEVDSPEWREWVASHFRFTKTLESLGFAVVNIVGGKLIISGSTEDIYFVSVQDNQVDSPLRLGRYEAVVVDTDLTLDFNVAEEPEENSVIHNLRSGKDEETGDVLVNKSGEYALTLELNNTTDSALNPYRNIGGNLTVTVEPGAGELTLIKTGKEQLTVGGNLTTPGSMEVQEGTLELGGATSSVGSLEVESSAKLVLSDKAKLTMGNHQLTTGSISGPGELDWDDELSLSGAVELDGVKLDMEKGESLEIDGVTVRMGDGQIGGGESSVSIAVKNKGSFTMEDGFLGSGKEDGATATLDVKGSEFVQVGGDIREGAEVNLSEGATMEQSGGWIKGGTIALEGATTSLEQGERGRISGGSFTLENGASLRNGGKISGGNFSLSGSSTKMEGAGAISSGAFTLGEGATMSQSGSITGGTYELSGTGTSFTQTDGSISGVEFTLDEGATLTQSGGEVAGGTFSLSGAASLRNGGKISGGSFSLSGSGTKMDGEGAISSGSFTLSEGATMSQSGSITGGTYGLSGVGTSFTQTDGSISGVEFTLSERATLTLSGGEVAGGTFSLSGAASLRNGGKISGGSFSLSGSGTKMEGAGSISSGSFTLSEGATMSQSGNITGGTYELSGEGTSFTQADGSISGVEFTLNDGATLTQNGGEITDGVFTLSEGATMETSGNVMGGTFTLSGTGTSFTQSEGTIDGDVEITLKDGAMLALSGGSMAGNVTLEGAASVYDMGSQTAGGSVLMQGGRLENAGEFRGELSLETAKEYTEALELGGVDAARITKVVTGSSQTELHDLKSGSTLTFRDGESKMVVGAEHVYREGQEANSMVQFREGSGQIAFEGNGALQLHLSLEVLKGIDGNGIEGQMEILFTNGSFSGMPEGQEDLEAWLEERFVLDAGMEGISVLLLDDVHGGRLVLTGSTSGIWITSRNGQSVNVADLLNRYSAVIVDDGLTLKLPTTPEETPTIIHQLQNESDEHGDLLVQTEAGAIANHTVQLYNAPTNEHRNNGDTDFYGNISVEGEGLEAATLEKTGDARLTVHGDVTTDGTVRLSEGVLELEGEGNGIGALDMNGGELDVAGKLRLNGTTTLTETSAGTITGEGTVELGSGASLTLAGTVSYTVQSTELADGAQMEQQGESSITGGSFRLSGPGTAFVQEGGSISDADFSLTEGTAMEAGGSVTGGSIVLSGEGVKFTQTGGSLSGVEFELSEGATMETSGGITGGSMELSGTGTSLTQSAGSIGEDVQIVLKDGAGLVLSGGSMAGSVTLEGEESAYDMGGQEAGGSVVMKGGRLENAGNYTGTLTIQTDDAYTGDLELGGVDAALITDVQTKGEVRLTRLKEGSTLTLHGDHSMRVAVNNTNYGEQEAQALIEFNGTGGRVALEDNMTLLLDLSADVLAGLRKQENFELLFTNGNFVVPGGKDALTWVQEHFTFREVLEKLGFAVESVRGGTLIISGSTEDVYIVGEDGSVVDSALRLGRYKGVIVDEDLTLDLEVQEDAAENSVLRNVDSLGKQTDLNVEKSGEGSITVELHNDEDTDTELGGDLTVNKDEREGTGRADLLKSGSGKLTVGGKLQTEDNLTVADGTLALEGQGSSVGSLNLGGADEAGNETSGELQVDGTLTLTGDSDMSDDRGSITGGGRLVVDGEVQLGEGVKMDGPALELGSEGSVTASGELRLQGVNGQGSLSGRDVTVEGSGGSFGGTLAGSLTVEGRGAQQTLTGEVQGSEADLHVQDGGTLTLQGARMARSGEEPLPSVGNPSYRSVENGQGGTLRIEAANEEVSGRGGAGIHVEEDIVFRDDSTTELVFNMNSDQLWDEHDATMLETDRTIYIEDNAHFVLESLGEGFSPKLGDLLNVKVMQGSKVVLGAYAADDEGSAAAGEEAGGAALYSEGAPEENGLTGDGEADGEVELTEEASPEISRNLDVVELRGLFHVYFTGAWLGVDESTGTVYLNGKYRTASLFNGVANSRNSHAGANLLWETSQVLNLFADQGILSVMSARVADTLDSDPAESRRIMAAVAGSTVTSLSAAQRDVMRGRMQSVRNHAQAVSAPYESIEQKTRPYRVIPVKGWKDGEREEPMLTRRDVRGLHAWVEGVGHFHEQHTRGDESGYRLNAWGGAAGADLRLSGETVVGLSLSALYGDLTANASDTAKGDWDSYTVSLWGRTRDDRWAHTFVVSAGLNDAKLNRTVNYGAGSYTAHGKTDGYSLGALYELSYDVPLNRDSTHVLQPFATASVMHGVVRGYAESSPDRTGLNVGEQDLTLATLALGTRWLMLTNASKALNRTIRTELRAAVAQDFGERRAKADVALQANPGYATGVYGSRAGSTALQFGGNVLIPVTGSMDMTLDANADLRAHSAGWNASVGVRFGF